MLDPTRHSASAPALQSQNANRPVFRMVTNDRMGGSIPAWVQPENAKDATLSALERAEQKADKPESFAAEMSNALAYRNDTTPAEADTPFGFGDLIDIINPLQHIPVVNVLYRNLTGDQIRSSTAVIGDTLFGGLAGAAGSLANLIMKEESGRDFSEHALQMVQGDTPPQTAAPKEMAVAEDAPLARLANAGNPVAPPGSALSFLDMAYRAPPHAATTITTSHATAAARVAAMYKFNA